MLALLVCAVLSGPVQETITVARVLVDVRVTRYDGEQIPDLTPADFNVRIGGKRTRVESAEWIDDGVIESSSLRVDEQPSLSGAATTSQPARLFVFFVQTDFSRDDARTEGQMHFLPHARDLADSLAAKGRVAVLSFDSHLKFRLDFSHDRAAIREALDSTLFVDEPPAPPVVPSPSLATRLDRDAMRRAADSETALLLVANALTPVPGPKTLLLVGWGLGELTMSGVRMRPEWKATRRALEAAHVTIISLDTTKADAHDLQAGLEMAAEQTGGFYAKTHIFPRIAIERVQRTLAGHYELELRAPSGLSDGAQTIDVRVKRRGVLVLAPEMTK